LKKLNNINLSIFNKYQKNQGILNVEERRKDIINKLVKIFLYEKYIRNVGNVFTIKMHR